MIGAAISAHSTLPHRRVWQGPMRLVADVKTVNPVCDTHLESSSRSALSAAGAGEREKVHKYDHLAKQAGAEFIGLG